MLPNLCSLATPRSIRGGHELPAWARFRAALGTASVLMVTQPEIMPCLWLWKTHKHARWRALRRLPACQEAAWRQPRAERRTGERQRPGRSGRWRRVAAPGARCGRAARGPGDTTLRGPLQATRAPARPARRTTGSPGAAWSDAESVQGPWKSDADLPPGSQVAPSQVSSMQPQINRRRAHARVCAYTRSPAT